MPRQFHCLSLGLLLLFTMTAAAQQRSAVPAPPDAKPMSITLEDVPYPHPIHFMPLTLYGQDVRMAYMDVPAAGPANGHTAVLLHGMNFYGEYWKGTIEVLRNEGFRVVVPDQVGFGRSTKAVIPYTLSDMASNTRKLLQTLGIEKAMIVGHSMGGMVATRFGLLYPDVTEKLVLYNQIGIVGLIEQVLVPGIDTCRRTFDTGIGDADLVIKNELFRDVGVKQSEASSDHAAHRVSDDHCLVDTERLQELSRVGRHVR